MAVTTPAVPASGTAQANLTGQWVNVAVTGGTVTNVLVGYGTNPAPAIGTPAVPATTVPVTNTNPFPVAVTIAANGATISAITVGGSSQGTAAATYIVPAGGTIAISYTVATPTWSWAAAPYGVSGNPVSSPYSIPLPPGCSITLVYSVAPTWAWTNTLDESQTPGFQYPSNTLPLAGAGSFNQYTSLPYAQHATLAQSGLATGVSN